MKVQDLATVIHVHGTQVENDQEVEFWVVDGYVSYTPTKATKTISGWILPGLVDAHCHVGLCSSGKVEWSTAEEQAKTDLATGVTLIRDAGTPMDTRWLDGLSGMPAIIRAGRHIARPKRYIRGFAVEVEPEDLVEEVRTQARAGDGWVKLVGDWIDRDLGDLAPLWPKEIVQEAIVAAHDEGAKVTAHCFGEDSVHQLVNAGIDCIEHGCGLDGDTIAVMARHQVALVPTLDNLKIFPGIAAQAEDKFPKYAAHMRNLYECSATVVAKALEAGVSIYAGTDAGGTRAHGTIMDEVRALAAVGGAQFALGAVSWRAREWLQGSTAISEGAIADVLVAPDDPRADIEALSRAVLLFA
ncbi:MAG: amidohydrolase family protein [Propionibacteriaceae bacterium]|nr:amidohydrolase family protein [Propionibacteriaceae bacterium]